MEKTLQTCLSLQHMQFLQCKQLVKSTQKQNVKDATKHCSLLVWTCFQVSRASKKFVSSDQLASFDSKECSQVFATAPVGKKVTKKWQKIAKASKIKCFAFFLASNFFKLPQPQHCTHNGETKNAKTDHWLVFCDFSILMNFSSQTQIKLHGFWEKKLFLKKMTSVWTVFDTQTTESAIIECLSQKAETWARWHKSKVSAEDKFAHEVVETNWKRWANNWEVIKTSKWFSCNHECCDFSWLWSKWTLFSCQCFHFLPDSKRKNFCVFQC